MKKWIALMFSAALVAADQAIKLWARESLQPMLQIKIIPGLFNLTYVENRGAAFGIFQGQTLFLSVVSGILLLAIVCAVILGKIKPDFLLWPVCAALAGGTGNLIDRLRLGYVVDYLDFSALFGFPVFNLADCCVVISTFILFVYFVRADMKPKPSSKQTDPEEA